MEGVMELGERREQGAVEGRGCKAWSWKVVSELRDQGRGRRQRVKP